MDKEFATLWKGLKQQKILSVFGGVAAATLGVTCRGGKYDKIKIYILGKKAFYVCG